MLNKFPINLPEYIVELPIDDPVTAGPTVFATESQGASFSVEIVDPFLTWTGEVLIQGAVGYLDSLVYQTILTASVTSGLFSDATNRVVVDLTTTQLPYLRVSFSKDSGTVGVVANASVYLKPL